MFTKVAVGQAVSPEPGLPDEFYNVGWLPFDFAQGSELVELRNPTYKFYGYFPLPLEECVCIFEG